MEFIIFILLIAIIGIFIVAFLDKHTSHTNNTQITKQTNNLQNQNQYKSQIVNNEKISAAPRYLPYAKGRLLTKTEQLFFRFLVKEALKRRLLVCPKVRLEDIIYVTDYRNKLKYRGYIKSRHVDFVLINTSGETIAAIELDDPSHNTSKAAETDQFKNDLFKKVGIPLIRIKTGVNYIEHLNNAFDLLHLPKSELKKTQP